MGDKGAAKNVDISETFIHEFKINLIPTIDEMHLLSPLE